MEKNYCPVNGWDCPYFGTEGRCILEDPFECDDFVAMAACLEDDSNTIYIFGSIE